MRFLLVIMLLFVAGAVHAGSKVDLRTTSPQGKIFKLSERFVYPSVLDQLDEAAARMQTSINPKGRFKDMRYMRETEGQLIWHFAWYQVGNEPVIWPRAQAVTAVFRNAQEVTSAEVLLVTADEQRRPIKVGQQPLALNSADLRRPSNQPGAVLVFVGFPADFRLNDGRGRSVNWSLNDVVSIRVGPEERSAGVVR